jgi:nucleotide-binding universal stress UspA family protein
VASSDLIVSYDGTPNDDDALALGKLLARTGASMALAYIRHSREFDPRREELAQHDAERRLEQGVAWLGDPSIPRHVVFSGSTGEGLEQLAAAEQASVIVFGSDYRTPPGRAEPGTTAQRLLEGGKATPRPARAPTRWLPRWERGS